MATVPNPPPGFDDLPIEDRIDYVQSLWERIAASPEKVPVPAWHRTVIEQRLREHAENPGSARPWDEVKKELGSNLGPEPSDE